MSLLGMIMGKTRAAGDTGPVESQELRTHLHVPQALRQALYTPAPAFLMRGGLTGSVHHTGGYNGPISTLLGERNVVTPAVPKASGIFTDCHRNRGKA